MTRPSTVFSFLLLFAALAASASPAGEFRAGAFSIDITPVDWPVIVNGYTTERTTSNVRDPLHANCLVLEDADTTVAMVTVDSCLIPRDVLDIAKGYIATATGIPSSNIMISATHTHDAPSVMAALGSRADADYVRFLQGKLAEGVAAAAARTEPAQVGWTTVDDYQDTHCRRWVLRPDRTFTNVFGEQDRAMMHPGYQDSSTVGPTGPVDPALSLLSVQTADGSPLALYANYSQHYYATSPVSAEWCGLFTDRVEAALAPGDSDFVAAMSQGTSGDLMWCDYSRPNDPPGVSAYTQHIVDLALEAYGAIEYHDDVPLDMLETEITLDRRTPDVARLAWAESIVGPVPDPAPLSSRTEIYAREQLYLNQDPTADLKLQALRIGDLGITAIPNEVYALTGLKLKAQSPFETTFNVTCANGAEGYIPPPEQHVLGGYSTWEARTAGLVEEAEPVIVENLLGMLETLSGEARRDVSTPVGAYTRAVLDSGPAAYWRLGEMEAGTAVDATPNGNDGTYEDGVVFYLPGTGLPSFAENEPTDRAAHFAGGRTRAEVDGLGERYSVATWIYNGMPNDARVVTGYFFSRGADGAADAAGDHLGIIGAYAGDPGRLLFYNGNTLQDVLEGETVLEPHTWNHVVMVRDGDQVEVYLNGNPAPEISGEAAIGWTPGTETVFLGGRNDNFANLEGKLDETAVWDRTLGVNEIQALYRTAFGNSAYTASVLENGPAAYWKLDELAPATAALDATGNRHTFAYQNDVRRLGGKIDPGPESPCFGVHNNAATLRGEPTDTREAGYLGVVTDLLGGTDEFSADYSFETWFRLESLGSIGAYLLHRNDYDASADNQNAGDYLGLMPGGEAGEINVFFMNGVQHRGNDIQLYGESNVELDRWYHLGFIRDGDTVSLYLDGLLEATGTAPHQSGTAWDAGTWTFGGRLDLPSLDQHFHGSLDEMAVYAGALDPAVFAEHAALGNTLEGDLDGDGFVGSGDLDIVRANWGRSVAAGNLAEGDASGDGRVDSADLDVVRANWGSGAASVPEPGTAGLIVALGWILGWKRRPGMEAKA